MRELKQQELGQVSGGHNQCTISDANNVYAGIVNPNKLGRDLIAIYEGVVMGTSHVIERVSKALD